MQDIKRRDLLKGMAAAAVVAPTVVPSSVFGDEEKAAPSERVTIGHIGVGGRGRGVFGGIRQSPLAQSVAVADCYKDRRENIAKVIGGTAYADFRDLLARDDIDGVVIATPDHWHVPAAILAAKAGKGAYVEKPLGLTVEQDLACEKVFADNGVVFQYGTQQRSMKHCFVGCELVRRGAIGKVHTIEVDAPNGGRGGNPEPMEVPEGFDYDMWLGPAPVTPYTRDRCKPPGTYYIYDQSIGYLGGWGAHPLDIMVWGSDADLSGRLVVEGTGEIPTEGLYDTVINWDMKIKLGDVDMIFKPGSDRTKFIGDKGWIEVRRGGTRTTCSDPALLETELLPEESELILSTHHQDNFVQAIKKGDPMAAVSNLRDAVRSDIISLLCDIVCRTGEKVTWDPTEKKLINPSEAQTAMLSRPMRAPWTL